MHSNWVVLTNVRTLSRFARGVTLSFLEKQAADRCLRQRIFLRKPYRNSRPAIIRRERTPDLDAFLQKRRCEIHVRNSSFEENEVAGRYGEVHLQFPQYAEPDLPLARDQGSNSRNIVCLFEARGRGGHRQSVEEMRVVQSLLLERSCNCLWHQSISDIEPCQSVG